MSDPHYRFHDSHVRTHYRNQHSLPNMGQKIIPEIVVHTHTLDSVGAKQELAALAWRNTSVP